MNRLISLTAAAALAAASFGTGCGGDDSDESIPVITGPTGATGFGTEGGLEDDEKNKDKRGE